MTEMCEPPGTKNDELKRMDKCNGEKKSPKHFLTWSASAANSRLQKMSKTLANNITRLQLKMEKAIPFQPEHPCGKFSEAGKLSESSCCALNSNLENNNGTSNLTRPDVKMSKSCSPNACCSPTDSNSSDVNLINKMVQQLEEIGRYHYDTRIQSARIVQSHPSVSQAHSQGSVANPDKIIQIDIESYNKSFSLEPILESELSKVVKGSSGSDEFNVTEEKSDKMLDLQSGMDPFYDSGTGSGNTSMSGSSLSSPSIPNLPVNNIPWNRASSDSTTPSPNLNLNSSLPSIKSNQRAEQERVEGRRTLRTESGSNSKNVSLLIQDNSANSSGMSVSECTDETSLLIGNNKTSSKKGARNGGKNVAICNNKNSKRENSGSPVATSTPLRLKSLNSQAYPPSKLVVTIFEKERELQDAPWFQAGIPRETALEILRNEPIGSFIVRESTTKSGCFALSLRVPSEYQPCGIAHYLILKTSRGYKIKGFTKEFGSLSSLITHHSVMSELLPCTLSLDPYQSQKKSLRISRANSSDFMEPEKLIIGTFTDF